jgi:hypothetical protein
MDKTLTQEQRVELYVKILREKFIPKGHMNEFGVAYLRNAAPTQIEMDALNAALLQLGWQK